MKLSNHLLCKEMLIWNNVPATKYCVQLSAMKFCKLIIYTNLVFLKKKYILITKIINKIVCSQSWQFLLFQIVWFVTSIYMCTFCIVSMDWENKWIEIVRCTTCICTALYAFLTHVTACSSVPNSPALRKRADRLLPS